MDGNGRTARQLMNYIQFCYNLFPTKIFKEDREEYISALGQSQEEETDQPFLDFMAGQLKKSLSLWRLNALRLLKRRFSVLCFSCNCNVCKYKKLHHSIANRGTF